MHCVIAAGMGAAGEVLPYLSIGAALRERGHRVTVVANPYYAPSKG